MFDDSRPRLSTPQKATGASDTSVAGERAGSLAEAKVYATDAKAEWKIEAADNSADVSADLSEEEEQQYLLQLERKKAAKEARQGDKREFEQYQAAQISPCLSQTELSEQDTGADQHRGKEKKVFAATASISQQFISGVIGDPESVVEPPPQNEPPKRKFRVLPAVVVPVAGSPALSTASSPQTSINEPRILAVKLLCQERGLGGRALKSPTAISSLSLEQESSISPFSAFYRAALGPENRRVCGGSAGSATASLLRDAQGSDEQARGGGGECPADKSEHVATASLFESTNSQEMQCTRTHTSLQNISASSGRADASPMLLPPSPPSVTKANLSDVLLPPGQSGGSISSREMSFAPKAQRIWVFGEPAPKLQGDTLKSSSPDAASIAATQELAEHRSVTRAKEEERDLETQQHTLPAEANKSCIDRTLVEGMSHVDASHVDVSLLVRSPKADSWSGIGVKLESIRSSHDVALVGALQVVNMQVGGPAEKAGLGLGDALVHLSNGVLIKGTTAMEATSVLRQQHGPYHIIVSRRRTSWGQQGHTQQGDRKESARRLMALLMQPSASSAEAFGTDLSCGFTLRDGKHGGEEWAGLPMVSDLIDGSSAHRSGLRIGDMLVGVGSLQVSKIPARVSVSLLLGEAGSQVLLAFYRKALHLRAPEGSSRDAAVGGVLDCVQWVLVERMRGSHVNLETTEASESKRSSTVSAENSTRSCARDDSLIRGALELSATSSAASLSRHRHRSPAPAPSCPITACASIWEVRASNASAVAPGVSPVASDTSRETYFAYRETADNSLAVSPAPEPREHDTDTDVDKSLQQLRRHSASVRQQCSESVERFTHENGALAGACTSQQAGGGQTDGRGKEDDDLDSSLVQLRKQARAREKRQAFLAATAAPARAAHKSRAHHDNSHPHPPLPGYDYPHASQGACTSARGTRAHIHTDEQEAAHAAGAECSKRTRVIPPPPPPPPPHASGVNAAPAHTSGPNPDRRFAMMRTMMSTADTVALLFPLSVSFSEYICVYIYICMYIHTDIHIHVHVAMMRTTISTVATKCFLFLSLSLCIHICIYIYICTFMYTNIYIAMMRNMMSTADTAAHFFYILQCV